MLERYKAVIFDLDGTLTAEKNIWWEAVRSAVERNASALRLPTSQFETLAVSYQEVSDFAWSAYSTKLAHFTSTRQIRTQLWTEALTRIGVSAEPSAVERLVGDFAAAQLGALRPDPALVDRMSVLASTHRLGVCTNGRHTDQVDKLRRIGLLHLLSPMVCGMDLGVRKPDQRLFCAAAARVGQAPQDCLFVGDDLTLDILPARAAGMGAVWITADGTVDDEVATFPNVPAALAALLGDS